MDCHRKCPAILVHRRDSEHGNPKDLLGNQCARRSCFGSFAARADPYDTEFRD